MSTPEVWANYRGAYDPRWHFMGDAVKRIHDELSSGDRVLSVTVTFEDPDFARVLYVVFPGEDEVRRYICTDPERAGDAFEDLYADATPEDSPGTGRR